VNPFEAPGEWLRCQLHCHTDQSDGEPTPAELVAHYEALGCDVLVITDHWLITRAESQSMLLIPGSELSAGLDRAPFEAEVLALGIDELPEPRAAFPSIADCAAWIVEQGGVAYLAHPRWSSLTADDYLSAPALSGLEIYNGGCEVEQGNGLSEVQWDQVKQLGGAANGVATDDSHQATSANGSDAGLGWTVVRAAARTREAVLDALRSGAFYSTTGPELISLELVDDGIVVRCSPATSVALHSGAWGGERVNADSSLASYRYDTVERSPDGLITAARFAAPEHWEWARIGVTAADGGRAWSNPFPLPGERTPFPQLAEPLMEA
jgi:hypothetical protein